MRIGLQALRRNGDELPDVELVLEPGLNAGSADEEPGAELAAEPASEPRLDLVWGRLPLEPLPLEPLPSVTGSRLGGF